MSEFNVPLSITIPKLRPGAALTNTPSSKILYDEIKTLCARSALRYRAACAKLFEYHRRGVVELSETTRQSLALGAAAAIATARSMSALKEGQASAFEHDQSLCIQKELQTIKNRSIKDYEIAQENIATKSERVKYAFEHRNDPKTKGSAKKKGTKTSSTPRNVTSKSRSSSFASSFYSASATRTAAAAAASASSSSSSSSISSSPSSGRKKTSMKLVQTSFESGSYGIELGGLSMAQGQGVILVAMEPGGQAKQKFSTILNVGMKLMKVENNDVEHLTLAKVIGFMSTATRPVMLWWRDEEAQNVIVDNSPPNK